MFCPETSDSKVKLIDCVGTLRLIRADCFEDREWNLLYDLGWLQMCCVPQSAGKIRGDEKGGRVSLFRCGSFRI